MADSDGISASAGSSGADSSLPASCAVEEKKPRVDFYVIEEASPVARLKLACRLAEKAYLASQRALIWHTERAELESLDELLWTFADGSFVPHEWLTSNGSPGVSWGTDNSRGRVSETSAEAPVLLSAGVLPEAGFGFIVNLAADTPPFLHLTRRVAEIIDGDEVRRRAGRLRFKTYRELGIEPNTIPMRHAQS